MSSWEDFEVECLNCLRSQFGDLAEFELRGGSNSNESDIKVTSWSGATFYIEVKSPSSQCSQFVLFPNEKGKNFIYSPHNKLKMNPFTQGLVDYMNDNYEAFKNPTSAGISLESNLAQAMGHIRYQHMVKNVEFFISKNNLGYVLIPLSLIGYYFEVETVYRTKLSGSRKIPKKDDPVIFSQIEHDFNLRCFRLGDKIFVPSDDSLINKRFYIDGKRYMFKKSDDPNLIELRGLATTNNPNIIFTINLKNNIEGFPYEYFRHFLRTC